MITLSDNTATNMLIRTVGIDELKRGFAQMGLVKTQIQRELFDDEAAAKGLENYISPEEIAMLLKQICQPAGIGEDRERNAAPADQT